jgi:hypothetical protein
MKKISVNQTGGKKTIPLIVVDNRGGVEDKVVCQTIIRKSEEGEQAGGEKYDQGYRKHKNEKDAK